MENDKSEIVINKDGLLEVFKKSEYYNSSKNQDSEAKKFQIFWLDKSKGCIIEKLKRIVFNAKNRQKTVKWGDRNRLKRKFKAVSNKLDDIEKISYWLTNVNFQGEKDNMEYSNISTIIQNSYFRLRNQGNIESKKLQGEFQQQIRDFKKVIKNVLQEVDNKSHQTIKNEEYFIFIVQKILFESFYSAFGFPSGKLKDLYIDFFQFILYDLGIEEDKVNLESRFNGLKKEFRAQQMLS